MQKVRESNIELLRIVSMFLVLLVHSNFFSLGEVSSQDILTDTLDATLRVLFEATSIACVDIFILISGWFGIRPKLRSLSNFIFQCLFFLIGSYIVAMFLGKTTLSLEGMIGCVAGTNLNWFIKAYLFLYVLAPVLNQFVEHSTKRTFKVVLIGFFALQIFYGWLLPSATTYIEMGYSPISFIGLYLLARYIRFYRPKYSLMQQKCDIVLSFFVIFCVSILYITPPPCCWELIVSLL